MAAKPRKSLKAVRFKRKSPKQSALTLSWSNNYVFNVVLNGQRGKLVTRPYEWQYATTLGVFDGRDAWNLLIDILAQVEYSNPAMIATLPGIKKSHDFSLSEKMRGLIVDVIHTLRVYELMYEATEQDRAAFDDLRNDAVLALVRLHQHDRAIAEREVRR